MATVLATLNCSLDTGYAFVPAGTPVELDEAFVEELRGMGHVLSASKIRKGRKSAAEYFDAAREEELSGADIPNSSGADAPATAPAIVTAEVRPSSAVTTNQDSILDSIIEQDAVQAKEEA